MIRWYDWLIMILVCNRQQTEGIDLTDAERAESAHGFPEWCLPKSRLLFSYRLTLDWQLTLTAYEMWVREWPLGLRRWGIWLNWQRQQHVLSCGDQGLRNRDKKIFDRIGGNGLWRISSGANVVFALSSDNVLHLTVLTLDRLHRILTRLIW